MLRTKLILAAWLAGWPLLSISAEGWTYEVLNSNPGPENAPVAINDLGEAVFAVRESLPGSLERGLIILTDGVTETRIFETPAYPSGTFPLSVQRIDVNNAHQVAFFGNLPGTGNIPPGMFRVLNGAAVPVSLGRYTSVFSNADLNNAGSVVFVGIDPNLGGSFNAAQVVTSNLDGQLSATSVFAPHNPFAANYRVPVINDNGDTASATFSFETGGSVSRVRLWRNGGSAEDNVVEAGNGSNILGGLGLNNAGFVTATTNLPGSLDRRLVLVVPSGIQGIPGGVVEIARNGGNFIELHTESAVSNTNAVTYSGWERNERGDQLGFIAVRDQGAPPVVIARTGDSLFQGGPRIDLEQNSVGAFMSRQSVNERGQVVFRARVGGVRSIIRATPEPGLISPNPILPAPGEPGRFRFCRGGWVAPDRPCFVDPPVAIGYTYTSEHPSLRFSRVVVPTPLPGGDAQFQVEFENHVETLIAGQSFNFEAYAPGGVATFRITGIELDEALDPANPVAFVTGLTPSGLVEPEATLTMVPIVENTDDFDGDGVIASRDNCTLVANADQADQDGDGRGNLCDNCPATANPDQADSDGNGIGDACQPVVRACSVDSDGDIDRNDIALITAARNQAASGPTDPRDPDRNRMIDVNDARACTRLCDRANCATL